MSKGILKAALAMYAMATAAERNNFIAFHENTSARNINSKSRFKQRMAFKKYCKSKR